HRARDFQNADLRPRDDSGPARVIDQQADFAKGLTLGDDGNCALLAAWHLAGDDGCPFQDEIHPIRRVAFLEDCRPGSINLLFGDLLQGFKRSVLKFPGYFPDIFLVFTLSDADHFTSSSPSLIQPTPNRAAMQLAD